MDPDTFSSKRPVDNEEPKVGHPNRSADQKWHEKMLSLWSRAISAGDFQTAIKVEELHYREAVKRYENVENWDRWQADTLEMRQTLTQCIQRVRPVGGAAPTVVPGRCLIVYNNQSGLAHEAQMARNLNALRDRGYLLDVEVVYLLGPVRNREKAQEMFGTEKIHYLQARSLVEAGGRLNALSQLRCVASIVYPTSFILAFWMSLFVDHHNQKFLQMKYYPLHAGRISRWAGGQRNNDQFYTINGCDFEQLPVLDLMSISKDVNGSRVEPKGPPVFGSISRSEKILNLEYNRFIHKVLERHEQLLYAFTGRPESRNLIPEFIRFHPRSDCWGWVDPHKAIERFLIYLEPFPWGGGDMTLLALARGIPYLTLKTTESESFGISSYLRLICQNKNPITSFSFCDSLEVLSERFDRLLFDSKLRRDLGSAWTEALKSFESGREDAWVDFLTS